MPQEFVEIKIAVPYGHISGKAWGNPKNSDMNIIGIKRKYN
jgi:hypothetical protein